MNRLGDAVHEIGNDARAVVENHLAHSGRRSDDPSVTPDKVGKLARHARLEQGDANAVESATLWRTHRRPRPSSLLALPSCC